MTKHSVAVVGAGLSGLTVAYRLLQQGLDVHVYEARQRVGGRVLTAWLNGIPVELGAQNILDGGKAENIQNLITEFQLPVTKGKIKSRYQYFDGTKFMDIDEVLNHWDGALPQNQLFQRLKYLEDNSQNMAQVLRALFASRPELYTPFSIRLMGYEGIPVEQLSTRYALTLGEMLQRSYNLDENDYQYFNYAILDGGNAQLVAMLQARLNDRLSLNMPLRTIIKHPSSYTLNFCNGKEVEADRVVLAFPCSVYRDIEFNEDEALLSRLDDIKAVAYGEHAKLMVPTSIPEGAYGLYANDRFATFSMATPNIVTMYYLNRKASFTSSTIQQIFKQDQLFLERIYGNTSPTNVPPIYARGEQFASYSEPVGYNWADDPYSQGTYSCVAAGQEDILTATSQYKGETVRTLFSPIQDRLFFAGEHASILMDVMGTMEAAVEAGERVARMITSAALVSI